MRSTGRSMRVAIVFIALFIVASFGLLAEEPGETRVTVRKGTVVVEHDDVTTTLTTGQDARLVEGAAAEVTGAQPPAPPSVAPIDIQWEPGQTVLMVEGQGILLRAGSSGSEGKSQDGRFSAKLTNGNELVVADLTYHRQSIRTADGRWVHRFSGCEMRTDPRGATTVRLPDGRQIGTSAPVTETPVPEAPPVVPAGYRWQIGIHLDKAADGLRVAGVSPGSPAEAAGFQSHDDVLAIGDLEAPTLEQIQMRLQQARPAQKIPFTVRRAGKSMTLTVVMGAWE